MSDNQTAQSHRIRKAWRITVKGYDNWDIYFAATAGKARVAAWRQIYDRRIRIIDIVARRAASRDVMLPTCDPIVGQLSDQERLCLLHAFGANTTDPTKASYRDYFYTTRDDPRLVGLADRGLMKPMDGDKFKENMTYFVLTAAGKRVALSMVPEYAHDH